MLLKQLATLAPLLLAIYMRDTIGVCIGLSFTAYVITDTIIPSMSKLIAAAGMVGKDLNKVKQSEIPESLGIAAGAVYLSAIFLFFPFPFMNWSKSWKSHEFPIFPFQQLGEYTSALLSICCMLFLGFADDVMNVKWRHKVILPALSSLPLLMIYAVTCGVTKVVVPKPLRFIFGGLLELGAAYYGYMAALTIFCTHSINILAGVNGVEVGQTVVIAAFVIANDIISIAKREAIGRHMFSIHMVAPFLAVSLALLKWNWYPARVFVGDTFCYFAGMTFAVVGILGHFSKTLLLLFVPQVLNFIYSVPQLFGVVPCPRHRLPRLNPDTGNLEPSTVEMKKTNNRLMHLIRIGHVCGLLRVMKESEEVITINNLTILNWLLITFGPMREDKLAMLLMSVQAATCTVGLYIRHKLSVHFF